MMIGLCFSCSLSERLLVEQLAPAYPLAVYQTAGALEESFLNGNVVYSLLESDTQFIGKSTSSSQIFPKPLCLSHLLTHVSSFISQHTHQIGPYLFSPDKRRLEKIKEGRKTLKLREKETELLLFLLNAPGKRAARTTLLRHIWGVQLGMETRTLETHVYQLRQKIERDPQNPALLLNTEGGYQLVC